ncbi:ccnl1 [Symbiodinium natans]|uniref:Ccnl1 protein n=1 Tax=Symbiodinium natans TaxID=878477 RepID=A0A812PTN9_9DINO|nr:ccnl1 [Symbiodinium natans]
MEEAEEASQRVRREFQALLADPAALRATGRELWQSLSGQGTANPVPLVLGCLLSRAASAGAAVDEEALRAAWPREERGDLRAKLSSKDGSEAEAAFSEALSRCLSSVLGALRGRLGPATVEDFASLLAADTPPHWISDWIVEETLPPEAAPPAEEPVQLAAGAKDAPKETAEADTAPAAENAETLVSLDEGAPLPPALARAQALAEAPPFTAAAAVRELAPLPTEGDLANELPLPDPTVAPPRQETPKPLEEKVPQERPEAPKPLDPDAQEEVFEQTLPRSSGSGRPPPSRRPRQSGIPQSLAQRAQRRVPKQLLREEARLLLWSGKGPFLLECLRHLLAADFATAPELFRNVTAGVAPDKVGSAGPPTKGSLFIRVMLSLPGRAQKR